MSISRGSKGERSHPVSEELIKTTTATTFRADSATRRTKECMLIAFALLLSAPALAAADSDSEMSQAYLACMDKSGGVTVEMLDCMSAELTRQDARLNESYQRLLSKLSAKRKRGYSKRSALG